MMLNDESERIWNEPVMVYSIIFCNSSCVLNKNHFVITHWSPQTHTHRAERWIEPRHTVDLIMRRVGIRSAFS